MEKKRAGMENLKSDHALEVQVKKDDNEMHKVKDKAMRDRK